MILKKTNRLLNLFLIASTVIVLAGCSRSGGSPGVLVFTKAQGWKHSSIPHGIAAIQKLGVENNFFVDTTKDASIFNDDDLKKYHAIIFFEHYRQHSKRRTTSSL